MGMTPEERDRLAKLEVEIEAFEASIDDLKGTIKDLTKSVDSLRELAVMGRGAWWLALKIGGLIVGAVAMMAAALNVFEKMGWR